MNEYQQKMYDDLLNLTRFSEAFYFKDFEQDTSWYRIFNYRLSSYTEFCQDNATECRGVMFEVDQEGRDAVPLRLASLPMHKFFNLYENPFTMDLDLSSVDEIGLKADGSLISTYLHDSKLRLKSKGSLASDQALDAFNWLWNDAPKLLLEELRAAEVLGFTVNMEWTAPFNRIVLGYEEPGLFVLNIRNRETGEYFPFDEVDVDLFPTILSLWINRLEVDDAPEFIKSIPDMIDIEGYVVKLSNGTWIKIKTTWYLALHHTKDSINSPRRLYEAVLEEATDDMRSLFYDDPVALGMITDMEQKVEVWHNHLVDTVERYYERNKNAERKEYAVLGQQELNGMQFGLAMNRYLGKDVNYKDFMKRKWKDFGIKDVEKEIA